jgi:hypothetical protein
MKITFNLYNSGGFVSQNTLNPQDFAEFCKLAEIHKQTIKLVKAEESAENWDKFWQANQEKGE